MTADVDIVFNQERTASDGFPASREDDRSSLPDERRVPGLSCRFCEAPLRYVFVDLGTSPLCESYIPADAWNEKEPFYPLCAYVCEECFLVQLDAYVTPDTIFSEYAYFSSYSDTWLDHAQRYATSAIERFDLDAESRVVEVGSNDGYLLQYFFEKGISVLGVEPAANVAEAATDKDIPTRVDFFGEALAQEMVADGEQADLLVGNNVLAQVPTLNSFVSGIKTLLKPRGVATLEFPHLLRLMEENQFDTIYHEHFSYFSFLTVERIFAAHGLTLFDVEELSTHGGSLRIYARHAEDDTKPVRERTGRLREREREAGLERLETYADFARQVEATKRKLLRLLIDLKDAGHSIAGYGAPGKGNTLLNYAGIGTDVLDYTVDRNPYKQGRYLPGTRIPIYAPDKIRETQPEYVLILPWNVKDEIMDQMADVRSWGGRFIVPIPEPTVVS